MTGDHFPVGGLAIHKSASYPLHHKILNYWFPATEGYDVCPHWVIPDVTLLGSK